MMRMAKNMRKKVSPTLSKEVSLQAHPVPSSTTGTQGWSDYEYDERLPKVGWKENAREEKIGEEGN